MCLAIEIKSLDDQIATLTEYSAQEKKVRVSVEQMARLFVWPWLVSRETGHVAANTYIGTEWERAPHSRCREQCQFEFPNPT